MRKMISFIFGFLLSVSCAEAQSTSSKNVYGKVVQTGNQQAKQGVSLQARRSKTNSITNESGAFIIQITTFPDTLDVSFVGFATKQVFVDHETSNLTIQLEERHTMLDEVIINTGYQKTSPEKTTGSFVQIDNVLLNRRVGANILDRLEGIASGVSFNASSPRGNIEIAVRGKSTIASNETPLIVVDNFPYEGALSNINPNDVESITILKDAAAASIWGTRAGNGVIVITTKKGTYNKKTSVSFNSNISISEKPDPFYLKEMNTTDIIDLEMFLFEKGYYNNVLSNTTTFPAVSPVVGILARLRGNQISEDEANRQIDQFRGIDNRNDLLRYAFHNQVSQQYAVNVSGGSQNSTYLLSIGYDRGVGSLKNGNDRITVQAQQTTRLLKNLEFNAGLYFIQTKTSGGTFPATASPNKYERLVDDMGNGVTTPYLYRQEFLDMNAGKGLLDWSLNRMEDAALNDNVSKLHDTRIATGMKYQVLPGLSADMNFQFQRQTGQDRIYYSEDSYFTRDLINKYTQFTTAGVVLGRPIPLGGILDRNSTEVISLNGRFQMTYNASWNKHSVNLIGGVEARQINSFGSGYRLYGYNDELLLSTPVNYDSSYRIYPGASRARIPSAPGAGSETTDRFLSYYGNGAYTYKGRYILSASARIDASNYFGVKANQRAVPLWSTGVKWDIAKEPFYNLSWLPIFNLKASFGYNGNINKSLTAFTTASYSRNIFNLNSANIENPPNPDLKWERVRIVNLAVSFGLPNNIITGNVEFYNKKALDLIGSTDYDPTSGITSFQGNVANMKGKGWDIELRSNNIDKVFKWNTNVLFNFNIDEITQYNRTPTVSALMSEVTAPLVGYPVRSIFALQWAGLDNTGAPQGYLNKEISKDYSKLINPPLENLVYKGASRPTYFGSVRNSFSFKGISASVNILYKMGYYFKRRPLSYISLYSGLSHVDYYNRWQNPGDELTTNVPSQVYPAVSARDNFYTRSEIHIERADHVRLQDVGLNYDVNVKRLQRSPFQSLQLYAYLNNIGIIWRANKYELDPDYQQALPPSRTYSLGLRANF